jgi:hypothetical protein
MHAPSQSTKEKQYSYQGKTFLCDSKTIQVLNLALATNGKEERYREVKK